MSSDVRKRSWIVVVGRSFRYIPRRPEEIGGTAQ